MHAAKAEVRDIMAHRPDEKFSLCCFSKSLQKGMRVNDNWVGR